MSEKYLYKPNNNNNDFVVWMGFPGNYSFSMASLGYLWLFKILDECEDITAKRITSESDGYCISNVNAFGFSFSFDFDFLEIFKILEKYNIPLKSSQRKENYPFIFAGGPVVTANPEPYKEIFDFFIIGDGEDVNLKAIRTIKENINKPKNVILKLLSNIEGIYVPTSPHPSPKIGEGVDELASHTGEVIPVIKQTKKLSQCIYTPILSENSYFKDTFIIEIERGCANRCGFCLASYLNLPLRAVPENEIYNAIDLGLKYTDKIAFLGAEVSAHPKFQEICNYIKEKLKHKNFEMNFSSLRVDAISEDVVSTLHIAGQRNLTLAIEAGSDSLRKFINKNVSNKQIFEAAKIIKKCGLKGIKIYGMIGIPTETQQDIEEIVNIAKILKKENLEISFGFSTFVPKAHTPFQWLGREDTKSLERKSNFLQKELHKLGIQVSISSPKWDYWQAVLSRGDGSFTEFLIDTYKNGGKLGAFKAAAKKYNIDTDYYALKDYDYNQSLPWDFIDIKPQKEFLIQESKRLKSYRGL